jgi:hypothetical protein
MFPLDSDVEVVYLIVFFNFIGKLYVFVHGVEFLRYSVELVYCVS